jgi:hypothetical protein
VLYTLPVDYSRITFWRMAITLGADTISGRIWLDCGTGMMRVFDGANCYPRTPGPYQSFGVYCDSNFDGTVGTNVYAYDCWQTG